MRVIVSGASGFIGSHLCRTLIEAGHDVLGIVRRRVTAWRIDTFAPDCRTIDADLGEIETMASAIEAFAPEALVHLGWAGVAGGARNDSAQALNVGMTAQLLDLGIGAGIKTFVGIGSQAEFGPHVGVVAIDAATRPTTLYGEAKLAAGRIALRQCELASIRFAWLRIFSTFGPGDALHWLIPSTIEALRAGKRPSFTACEQRWGFLYVADAVAAIRAVLESPAASGCYNLGSAEAPPLRETLKTLRDLIDPSLELGFADLPYRPDQVMHLAADIGPLRRDAGWGPETGLEAGLRKTIAWHERQAMGGTG